MELSLHTGFQLATPPFQPSCFACQNALTQDVHNPWPGKCGTGKGYLGIRWGVYFGAAALGWVDGCRNPNRTRGGVVDPGRDRLTESTEEDPPFRPRGRMISIALEFLYDPICIYIYILDILFLFFAPFLCSRVGLLGPEATWKSLLSHVLSTSAFQCLAGFESIRARQCVCLALLAEKLPTLPPKTT